MRARSAAPMRLAAAVGLTLMLIGCSESSQQELSGSLPRCDQGTELPCRQEGPTGLEVVWGDPNDAAVGLHTVPAGS